MESKARPQDSWRRFSLVTLIMTVFVACCACAAIWQNYRYHYKKLIEHRLQLLNRDSPRPYSRGFVEEEFRFLTDSGHYLTDHLFLWGDQVRADRRGYLVMVPFLSETTGRVFLVDLGWLNSVDGFGSGSMLCLNQLVADLAKFHSVRGLSRRFPPKSRWFKTISSHQGHVLSRLDADFLSSLLQKPVDHWQLVFLQPAASCLAPSPQLMFSLTPERHLNYVYQWITFLFLALIFYIRYAYRFFRALRQKNESED